MRPYIKILFVLVTQLAVVAAGVWEGSAGQSPASGQSALKGPKAVFSETKYEFKPLFEGEDVTHDFVVENRGDAPLVIKNVKPG